MANVVNLTRPISEYLPVGAIFPWESPHYREDIATINRNRAHLFYIRMGSGTGTRIRSMGYGRDESSGTYDVPLDALVNREAVVLRIPKGASEAIDVDDVVAAVEKARATIQGSDQITAVVLATGWGDVDGAAVTEERVLESPHLTPAAADELAAFMDANSMDLLLTDLVEIDPAGGSYARSQWAQLVPWLRPAWPSPQAKSFLRHYSREHAVADHAAALTLARTANVVVGMANCGALGGTRCSVTVLPLRVTGVTESPCTVIAQPARA